MLITRAALPDGRTVDIRCTDTLTAVAQRLDRSTARATRRSSAT